VPTATRTVKPDSVGVAAVDAAREALLELVDVRDVGGHLGAEGEDERVVTHFFECLRTGYRGWRWAVTVARAPRAKAVTVDEVVLLPGEGAIVAPEWVPWRERIQPGDLSPGDILPTEEDDLRLVPAYLTGDPGDDLPEEFADGGREHQQYVEVGDELGLGRERVLSVEGRDAAVERWYDGDAGPESALAQAAPASCVSCGFLVRLDSPMARLFGVCANAQANDDGRVVSLDHGCGAHSQAQLAKRNQPQPLPDPVVDTLGYEELETF
jgi:Protein of unknown function (DUF3027)